MNCSIVILLFFAIIAIVWLCRSKVDNKKHGLKAYESSTTKPLKDKKKYKDEVDYFMTPVAQATRIENNNKQDKKELYNHYNEAIARYNLVDPVIRKRPDVPNIETIVNQRNRIYDEIMEEEGFGIITNNPTIRPVLPPIPVKKEKVRKDRLKIDIKASPQNVHDTNVNDELSDRYKQLKQNQLADDTSGSLYTDMIDFIHKNDKKKNIVNNFDHTDNISRFQDNEANIWYTVWKRIHAPENSDNVDSLKESFKCAIQDCTENGSTVCTVGRVTRALNSLTMMDKNEKLSAPVKTDDIERKEVYDQAHKILHRELDKMGNKFKELYESGEMNNTDEFDNKVKNAIRNELGKSKYLDDALAAI